MTTTMTPVDWAKRPIEKYAEFKGRASRPEFWWYTLAVLVVSVVVAIVERIVGLDDIAGGPLSLILMLGLLVPGLAVTVRRLHDTNRSGWWVLVAILPYAVVGYMSTMAALDGSTAALGTAGIVGIVALAGAIALLVLMVLPGTPGDNRHGPSPGADGSVATA